MEITVTGQPIRTFEQITSFHDAAKAIAKDESQRRAILNAAGFEVDAETATGISAD